MEYLREVFLTGCADGDVRRVTDAAVAAADHSTVIRGGRLQSGYGHNMSGGQQRLSHLLEQNKHT